MKSQRCFVNQLDADYNWVLSAEASPLAFSFFLSAHLPLDQSDLSTKHTKYSKGTLKVSPGWLWQENQEVEACLTWAAQQDPGSKQALGGPKV